MCGGAGCQRRVRREVGGAELFCGRAHDATMVRVSRSHRSLIAILAGASGACALVAWSAVALAQSRPRDVECKATETQAECHARLKCKADEELEDCQKRLRKAGDGGDTDDGARDGDRDDRGRDDRGRDDRGDRGDRGDSDRGDRWRDRDDGDDGGGSNGDGRWDRDRGDDDGGGGGDGGDRWRRRRGEGRGGGRDGGGGGFQANKTFGLGLEIGEPTGLNGKYFLSDSGALDFGVGWIYRHYYYDDGLHLYLDYLWHPTSLASSPSFELPLYIGLGLRYWDFEYCDGPFCYDGSAIGIRVPIGISIDFNTAPLDIFIQVVPVIDFLTDDYYDRYDDRTHFGIDLSAGLRYWFN